MNECKASCGGGNAPARSLITPVKIAAAIAAALPLATHATQIARDANAEIIRQQSGRTIYIYRQSGSITVTEAGTVDILLVGGGGGGGASYSSDDRFTGGGGGGGGVLYSQSVAVSPGTYSITVGNGGAVGENGGNTTAFDLTAYGGGAGGNGDKTTGNPGGNGASGGGAAHYEGNNDNGNDIAGGSVLYSSQGNLGNVGGVSSHQWAPGGGGGAGSPGMRGTGGIPGAGGDGVEIAIIGSGDYYGGGGAGRRSTRTSPSEAAKNVPGGNGGGGALENGVPQAGKDGLGGGGAGGAAGGSGVVIVAFTPSATVVDRGWFEGAGGDEVVTNKVSGFWEVSRIFRRSGTLTLVGSGTVDVLAVGGGGGGGTIDGTGTNPRGGAGGGGGGVVYYTNLIISAGTYAIEIGEGGGVSTNGFPTHGLGVTAFGGGAGADGSYQTNIDRKGKNGASGGGSTIYFNASSSTYGDEFPGGAAVYTAYGNLGNDGGVCKHAYAPGGGGGAGTSGGDGAGGVPGAGGAGVEVAIAAVGEYYGGGGAGYRYTGNKYQLAKGGLGGGGSLELQGEASPGEDGRGGGGCGGQRGGSGVFVIRYRLKPSATTIIMR